MIMETFKAKRFLICLGAIALFLTSCTNTGNPGGEPVNPPEPPKPTAEEAIGDPQYFIPDDDELDTSISANDTRYSAANVDQMDSYLEGKTIYWLGSSVTYGASSNGESMADFIAARAGCTSVKEAVSGTTLSDRESNSYVHRLLNGSNFSKDTKIDAFVCQISTNDAITNRVNYWGRITDDNELDIDAFDKNTTFGAVEYIIAYVAKTWDCPIYFYSGSWFGDGNNKAQRLNSNPSGTNYGRLVDAVKQIAAKWDDYEDYNVKVIDLFNDEDFNDLASDKFYSWAINDPIHPRKAGYSMWWSPYIQNFIEKDLYTLIEL